MVLQSNKIWFYNKKIFITCITKLMDFKMYINLFRKQEKKCYNIGREVLLHTSHALRGKTTSGHCKKIRKLSLGTS